MCVYQIINGKISFCIDGHLSPGPRAIPFAGIDLSTKLGVLSLLPIKYQEINSSMTKPEHICAYQKINGEISSLIDGHLNPGPRAMPFASIDLCTKLGVFSLLPIANQHRFR